MIASRARRALRFQTNGLWPEAGLALLALVLSWGFIAASGFDGLYGQDPYGYYTYAAQVGESVGRGQLPPPYYWPLGYPALVALGFALIGPSPLAGQIVSTLAGAGVVALTCVLARDLLLLEGLSDRAARWVGAAAGLLAIACGQLWQWSISVMADTTALCWGTLATWALVRYSRGARLRWLVLSALALACAVMTRWIYALLVLPLGAYWLLSVGKMSRHGDTETWRQGDEETGRQGDKETRRVSSSRSPGLPLSRSPGLPVSATLRHALVAVLVGLAALAPQIAISAASPGMIVGHQWLVGWSPLNALRRQFATPDGFATYAQPVALFYARAAASPRYLFPLFTPLLFLGLWTTFRRRWWRVATLLVGWGAVIYGFLCGIPYQNFRFTLTFLPPVAIVTAIGLYAAWQLVTVRWRGLLLACALAGIIGGLWYSDRVLEEFAASKRADLAVARWAERQLHPGDQVLAFGLTLTLQHYTALDVRELFVQTPEDLGALVAQGRPTYLLVAVDDLNRQWRDYAPERNYRWLRDGPGLVELGTQSGYTLFRVTRRVTTFAESAKPREAARSL